MKWKLIFGVVLVLILSFGSITIYNKLKHKEVAGNDSMEQMDGSEDSMAQMDTSNDSSMGEMDMGKDSMEQSSRANVAGYTGITLDARKQQLIGVQTVTVTKRALTRAIRAYGTTSHDTDLYAVQQEYLSAYRYYRSLAGGDGQDTAKMLLDSARKKLIIMGYSDAQLNRLVSRNQSDDSLVEGGASSRAWIYAQIYQKDLPYVQRGQRVRITSSELEGKTVYGTIDSIDSVVDPETRSIRARILTDSATPITHESYVNVDIEVAVGTVVALPEEAVIDSGERKIAFVSMGNGYYEPREIVLGRHAAGYYEVISGITAGEKVVSSANFFIDSESQLKAASGNMGGMEM